MVKDFPLTRVLEFTERLYAAIQKPLFIRESTKFFINTVANQVLPLLFCRHPVTVLIIAVLKDQRAPFVIRESQLLIFPWTSVLVTCTLRLLGRSSLLWHVAILGGLGS